MKGFMNHCDATEVTYETLGNYPAPAPTQSWKPVQHKELVDTLKEVLTLNRLAIREEAYSVGREGLNLFGVFTLAQETSLSLSSEFSLGFRHSNIKQFSIQIVAGIHVFVCDNLAFNGDMIALARKHTSGLSLRQEVIGGIQRYLVSSASFEKQVVTMQGKAIADHTAKAFLLDNVVQGNLPYALLKPSYHNYFEEQTEDTSDRTAWGLHNAITRAIKDSTLVPASKFDVTVELGKAIPALLIA